jgi:glycosyltransferase involved in cell wall biosynthesis
MNPLIQQLPYVLITPARNEATYIEKTIQSVIKQTVLPVKWVIVDDGSPDATASIVKKYLTAYKWIELIELPKHKERNFAGKVYAFNAGLDRVKDFPYEVIGNLDADISFDTDYFEFLLGQFCQDSDLGVAGTIFEEDGYSSATDSFEGRNHVPGQCQLFRRCCFQEIGGYTPHKAGGIDWMAVTTARMKGWKTRSFREKAFFHHRHLGTAERGVLASAFSYGEKDYYLGGHPVWEICRVAYRATKKPYVLGGMALCMGYLSALCRQMERPVSQELMRFHRKEQIAKLKAIVHAKVFFKEGDNFDVTVSQ